MAKAELKKKFATGKTPTGDDFAELIEEQGTPGPKGDKGDTGAKGTAGSKGETGPKGDAGTKGDKGAAGKDGFGTEAEFDDLVARIEALEA